MRRSGGFGLHGVASDTGLGRRWVVKDSPKRLPRLKRSEYGDCELEKKVRVGALMDGFSWLGLYSNIIGV